VPGRVFKGKVRYVLDAIAAGQLQPTGGLVDVGARTAGGRALAIVDITDDMSPYQIPLGAAAQVAIYTEYWHHVSLLRKDPAANAQLAELHLPGGALMSLKTFRHVEETICRRCRLGHPGSRVDRVRRRLRLRLTAGRVPVHASPTIRSTSCVAQGRS